MADYLSIPIVKKLLSGLLLPLSMPSVMLKMLSFMQRMQVVQTMNIWLE